MDALDALRVAVGQGRRSIPVQCIYCGWDDGGELVLFYDGPEGRWYAFCPRVWIVDRDGEYIGECGGCRRCLHPDLVVERTTTGALAGPPIPSGVARIERRGGSLGNGSTPCDVGCALVSDAGSASGVTPTDRPGLRRTVNSATRALPLPQRLPTRVGGSPEAGPVVLSTPRGDVEIKRTLWRDRRGQPVVKWSARTCSCEPGPWTVHLLLRIAVAWAFGYQAPPLPEWIDRVADQARQLLVAEVVA